MNTLTPTEGDTVVAEEYGTIIADIRLEGTFGIEQKRVSQFEGAVNGGDHIDGNQHFSYLRTLFREYSRRKKDPTLGPNTQLVFHSLREDDHFIVVPKQFSTPRSAGTNRIHYEYKIQLAAVGQADDVRAPTVSQDAGDAFNDALETISRGLNDARGAFNDVTSNLSTLRRRLGNIQAVMTQAAGLITAVGNAVSGLAQTIEYPLKLAATVAGQVGTAADDLAVTLADSTVGTIAEGARDLRRLEAAINLITSFPDRFVDVATDRFTEIYAGERRLTQRDVDEGTAGARPGSRTRVSYGTEAQAGFDLGDYNSVASVTVERTTTLAGLAARYAVPPELIVILNDLRPPYFAEGGGPGVLGPGDSVLIPSFATTSASPALAPVNTGYLTPEEVLYGRDLALDEKVFKDEGLFEIKVATTHGSFDAEIVGGVRNVVQGTRITVETERGTTIFIPDLGISRSVGKKGTINAVVIANLRLREAMLFDPRIDRILQQIVRLDADVLLQDVTVQLVGARSGVTFVRPFGRASGGS